MMKISKYIGRFFQQSISVRWRLSGVLIFLFGLLFGSTQSDSLQQHSSAKIYITGSAVVFNAEAMTNAETVYVKSSQTVRKISVKKKQNILQPRKKHTAVRHKPVDSKIRIQSGTGHSSFLSGTGTANAAAVVEFFSFRFQAAALFSVLLFFIITFKNTSQNTDYREHLYFSRTAAVKKGRAPPYFL